MYQINIDAATGHPSGMIRLSDGASIPEAPGNRDWEQYLAWRAAGNKPLKGVAPVSEPVADPALEEAISALVDSGILTEAQARALAGPGA